MPKQASLFGAGDICGIIVDKEGPRRGFSQTSHTKPVDLRLGLAALEFRGDEHLIAKNRPQRKEQFIHAIAHQQIIVGKHGELQLLAARGSGNTDCTMDGPPRAQSVRGPRVDERMPDGSRPPIWFALDETRPLAFLAGIWTRWTSVRKVKEGETTNDIFAFLTTEPNAAVKAFHPKAMPVILTTREEIDLWMTAPAPQALTLQRPLPDDALMIVARGGKKDEGVVAV